MIFGWRCKECRCEIGFSLEYTQLKDGHCPECEGEVEKAYIEKDAFRIELDPISGDFPGATDKWVKMRESHMRKEKKNMKNHGTYD
jgi:hypothetical protein